MDKEIKERFEALEEETKFTRELLISPSSNKQGLIQDVRELEHLYTVDIGTGVKEKLEALEAKMDIDTEQHVQDLEGNMSTIMEKVAALEVQNKGLKIYTEGLETNILENQEGYKKLEVVLLKFFNENIEYLKGASGFVKADERIIMYINLISNLKSKNLLYLQKTCKNFDPKNCEGCKWCSKFICKVCGKSICECEKTSAGNSVNTNSKSSELVPKVGITASNNAKSGSIPADPKAEPYNPPKCPYCDNIFRFDINDELFDCPHCDGEVSICELMNNMAIFLQTQIKSKIAVKLRKILKKRGAIIDDPSYPDGDQNFKRWLKKIEKDIGGN